MKKSKQKADIKDKLGYDPELINAIQPQGGISFKDEKFIKTGDGYEACIHIYAYPKQQTEHWLAQLCNIENAVVTVDVSTEDENTVFANINKSIKENTVRYNTSKDATDINAAEQRVQELNLLLDEITQLGESVKLITIRIFISDRTLDGVDKITKKIMNNLQGVRYKTKIFLNESKNEWKSTYLSYTEQQKSEYKRYGQPVKSGALAGGIPFHFSSLSDPYGTYLGTTGTGGSVLFDMFENDGKKRIFYNGVCLGNMGAGKSTLLKKLLSDMAIRGYYIRGFDVSGEYETLINKFGGKIVALDGTDGQLNALEVLQADENEYNSFTLHIAKLTTLYKYLVPDADTMEINELENLLSNLYDNWGLTTNGYPHKKITELDPKEYPIWSDLLEYINKVIDEEKAREDKIKSEKQIDEMKIRSKISSVISSLVKQYGKVFNGHTNIPNILNTQIVFFNIQNLANMKSEVFDAQMFLASSLCWDNCIKNGKKMKSLYDTKSIEWEDITRFMLFIDEAHRIINTNKLQALDLFLLYAREARKYFGGIICASQSIRDFVPEVANQDGVEQIKTFFDLTKYKFIMQQDVNSLELLNNVFKQQLTESDLEAIPRLEKGEMILTISSDKNIQLSVECSEEELDIFRGGA